MAKIIALSGMCGSGKSVIADELVKKGYHFLRFGQITLDIIKERGLPPTEENERPIREELRKEHGMGAFALLNIPKIDALLKKGNVVIDNLMSWSEYKLLKEKYGDRFIAVSVYAPPKMRYDRLTQRTLQDYDKALRHRPMTADQAQSRDYAEIEHIEKGGPIVMADFLLINTGTVSELLSQLDAVLTYIEGYT
ncbi:MAG: AAA family ATPase [archaeon]